MQIDPPSDYCQDDSDDIDREVESRDAVREALEKLAPALKEAMDSFWRREKSWLN